jgi:hypothetical protein
MTMDNNDKFSLANLTTDPAFNFLNKFLFNEDNDSESWSSPYNDLTNNTTYCDELAYCSNFKNCNDFSMLSLNIQSLSAKYNEFHEFISNMLLHNCAPDVICLQELWQFPNNVNFSINEYHPLVYKLRHNNVQGGGVGIYVKKKSEIFPP